MVAPFFKHSYPGNIQATFNLVLQDAAKVKKSSTAANVAITLQRRYMNMVVDSSRQKQFEMFLGLRRHKHLPTQPDVPLQALTRPHAWVLKPVPAVYPSLFPAQALLTGLPKGASWVRGLAFRVWIRAEL